jgi:hypothetical protein
MRLWNTLLKQYTRQQFCRCESWILLAFCIGIVFAGLSSAQTSNTETFTFSGSVVNSVTGEPIAHALVRTSGLIQRSVFTDGQGRFQMDGLPPAQVTVTVQKPGFVSDAGAFATPVRIGPNLTSLILKLAPQSAIYGRVLDANGQALEHVPVRLTARTLRDGRKHWEQRGMADTDEDGHYRFPNLMPDTYYVSAGPLDADAYSIASPAIATASEKAKSGFPHVYYPGVAELASALPIQLTPGQQAEADFSMTPVPVYQVSGTVMGHLADQGVGFEVVTTSNDNIALPINFNMETGALRVEGIRAGSYIIRAMSQSGMSPLRGEARINVASNVEDVRIVLAPAVTIPVMVRTESRSPARGGTGDGSSSCCNGATNTWIPVSVRLLPTDPNHAEVFSTFERGKASAIMLQNVDPGTYTAELMPRAPWYVQSATCGQTNLLLDDLYVASGQSYPMEIVLRDDSASLSATVKSSDANPRQATVIVVPQAGGKVAPRVVRGSGNQFSVYALAPGDYLVFAFDNIDDLEYTNAEAYAPYASQAAHVNLAPNQKARLSLDLIHPGKEQ